MKNKGKLFLRRREIKLDENSAVVARGGICDLFFDFFCELLFNCVCTFYTDYMKHEGRVMNDGDVLFSCLPRF